ncbi:MAG: DUF5054 domain-containing protein [Ruminococcaceae bacterium]|nr:DUF5054 domain-containing protein [Oscillospiraceae bacterium]
MRRVFIVIVCFTVKAQEVSIMKKVFVVSKTHLDLGFTDYAENIRQKYIDTFIPGAIDLAEKVNTDGKKNFIWTTGSWIIKEALNAPKGKEKLEKALREGNIVPHAMPFTTHSELIDADLLDFGLSITDKIDEIRGRKTVAAKMTDVPGHTKGIVPVLSKHGIRLLHIGVNGASALVDVPPCFLWKNGDSEVVVIYSGAYGGAFTSDIVEEILYFDHTLDNHGAPSPEKVLKHFDDIQKQYPDYEITAGTMDDFADIIWEKRELLPVFEGEMGDSWIHGSATDPYKSAALRTLINLKNKWLGDGSLDRAGREYRGFADALICIAEHTNGMDTKTYFSDYGHYLKKDFIRARKADKVKFRHLFSDLPQSILPLVSLFDGKRKRGYYSVIEKSWTEQREYINKALDALGKEHRKEAAAALRLLIPVKPAEFVGNGKSTADCGDWHIEINEKGGIGELTYKGREVIRRNKEALITYRSFCNKDYEYWLAHYSRDLHETAVWALGDFARPNLKTFEGKYPSGRFDYKAEKIYAEGNRVKVNLVCDKRLCEELGAPGLIQAVYTLSEDGAELEVSWFAKDANRLTEAIYLNLFPEADSVKLRKIDCEVSPEEVTLNGSRNLHAVQSVSFGDSEIVNLHSPLVSFGRGKILEFDNKLESVRKDGLSFVLYNNVWGTNFPLWYEDNARFLFKITSR